MPFGLNFITPDGYKYETHQMQNSVHIVKCQIMTKLMDKVNLPKCCYNLFKGEKEAFTWVHPKKHQNNIYK